jgi:uncharacterized protein
MTTNTSLTSPVASINGVQFRHLLAGAVAMLEQNYQRVNALNVFPVPDGDTGTNMLLTIRNAWKFVADLPQAEPDFGTVAVHFARGAIRGSRGNSGTILSELLRGFANETSSCPTVDFPILMRAFREAVKLAYSVVEKILTVAREVAEEIEASSQETQDLLELLRRASNRGKQAVARTPELLPILRKAGVVDSGGQGLAYLFEGMYRHAIGETLTITGAELDAEAPEGLAQTLQSADPEGYGYDVQFLLMGKNLDVESVRAAINNMGDSGVITGDDEVIKVHIHVHDPGVPLSYGVGLGVITDVVVENMQLQSEDYIKAREGSDSNAEDESDNLPEGAVGVVAVAPGEGFRRILRSMGVARVVNGGQTMNPSSEDLVNAINALDTAQVIVLPNNKNIILTAQQAAKEIGESSGKQVQIIPTRTIPQGIAAMLSYSREGAFESIAAQMDAAKDAVITGEVTTASRSVTIDEVEVQEGQIIGLADGKLRVATADVQQTLTELLNQIVTPTHELITLYYGDNVKQVDAELTVEALREAFPNQEFDLNAGGQPHYFYILSVE